MSAKAYYTSYELLALAMGEHEEEQGVGEADRETIEAQAPGLLAAIAEIQLSYNRAGGYEQFAEQHSELIEFVARVSPLLEKNFVARPVEKYRGCVISYDTSATYPVDKYSPDADWLIGRTRTILVYPDGRLAWENHDLPQQGSKWAKARADWNLT